MQQQICSQFTIYFSNVLSALVIFIRIQVFENNFSIYFNFVLNNLTIVKANCYRVPGCFLLGPSPS